MRPIHESIRAHRPHLLVNFFDLFGGLYKPLFRPEIPMVALGHQFLFFHPDFQTPREEWFQVSMIRNYSTVTSLSADLRLGLSFAPMRDVPLRRVRVVPPLLRQAVLDAQPVRGRHFLAYVLNPGYSEELRQWHKTQSGVELHCFWDKVDAPPVTSPWEGLFFHRLDDTTFLDLLSTSRGFASTAGFESVCEAAFLGKPVLLVPTRKHVEQLCNALDAERAGLATWRRDFDLSALAGGWQEWDPGPRSVFKTWVRSAPDVFVRLLEGMEKGEDPMRIPIPLPTPVSRRSE
jgi:uncharacterized protein (TIGR00661 family)